MKISIVIGSILLVIAIEVAADKITHNYYPAESTVNTTTIVNANDAVMNQQAAMGIAFAQHHPSSLTMDWQGSVGWGYFEGEQAISAGIAKKWCDDCPLINGTIGATDDYIGVGAGVNFRF